MGGGGRRVILVGLPVMGQWENQSGKALLHPSSQPALLTAYIGTIFLAILLCIPGLHIIYESENVTN